MPKPFIVARYFAAEQAELDGKQAELDAARSEQDELTEEHGGDEGVFGELEKVTAKDVKGLRPGLTTSDDSESELAVVDHWLALENQIAFLKKKVGDLDAALDQRAHDQYAKLTEDDIKSLVIDDKWLAELERRLHAEVDRVSQRLTGRIRELAQRYATPLPTLETQVSELAARVDAHLARMGAQA